MNSSARNANHMISNDLPAVSESRRKWVLTKEAFDRLLDSLGADRESAGEGYLEIRSNLIRFFEWRGSPFPEDHADETINRVAKRVFEGIEIRDPDSYCIGVARMILLEFNKELSRRQKALGELTRRPITSNQSDGPHARIECLRNCLRRLSPDNRELILQYYQGEKGAKIDSRKKLSERLGIPINTLRMRALRLREDLQRCVENCPGSPLRCQEACVNVTRLRRGQQLCESPA